MFWTVFLLLAAAGPLAVARSAVRTFARLREFREELALTRAELDSRSAALRAAIGHAQATPRAETARPGRTIGVAGGAAQRG